MNNSVRTVLGLALVVVGLFWNEIQERIPDFTPLPKPKIVINEPSEEIKEKISSVADLVTDTNDRTRLAVFNEVFSDRCIGYKSDNQQINDIYTLAGKDVFGESLKGKYTGYGESITKFMKDTLGLEMHEVTEQEKENLSKLFSGLAWGLSNK
tara:strand:+ start:605 stop:1063 length:459 start_codon:yes stop_codon:yes gene_type:complete